MKTHITQKMVNTFSRSANSLAGFFDLASKFGNILNLVLIMGNFSYRNRIMNITVKQQITPGPYAYKPIEEIDNSNVFLRHLHRTIKSKSPIELSTKENSEPIHIPMLCLPKYKMSKMYLRGKRKEKLIYFMPQLNTALDSIHSGAKE